MFYAIVAVICLLLDQLAKYWTASHIEVGETVPLIPGLLHLSDVHNTGAAFSFLQGARWFFVVLCIVFVAVVIYLMAKGTIRTPAARWSAVVIMAGAVGNCLDRVISGYVVDMIEVEFIKFPVFNVADIFITVGVIVFVIATLLDKDDKKAAAKQPAQRGKVVKLMPDEPAEPEEPQFVEPELAQPKAVPNVLVEEPEREQPKRESAPRRTRRTRTEIPDFPKRERVEEPKVDPADPFAEWEKAAAAPKQAEPAPAPAAAPAAQKPAQPAPAPKASEDEFDLDSILAEFRDS